MLIQVPNNGCLADYVTADQMVATYEELVAQVPSAAVLSLGFHQETAAKSRRALALAGTCLVGKGVM